MLPVVGLTHEEFKQSYSLLSIIFLATLTLPLNFKKDLGALSSVGKYGIFILIYVVMVLTIQAPAYASQPSVNYTPATTDLKAMLCSWGNFIYSFNCIVSVFVVKTSLKPLTQKRLSSTFSTTIFVILVFYSLIGLIGYVSLGDTVRDVDLIIERPALAGSSDIFMKIGIGRNLISYLFPSTRGFYCSHHSNQSTVHGTL